MNIPALTLLALLIALTALHAGEGYTCVVVGTPENAKISTVRKYPTGSVRFKEVPFQLPASRLGMETDGPRLAGPVDFGCTTIVLSPQ